MATINSSVPQLSARDTTTRTPWQTGAPVRASDLARLQSALGYLTAGRVIGPPASVGRLEISTSVQTWRGKVSTQMAPGLAILRLWVSGSVPDTCTFAADTSEQSPEIKSVRIGGGANLPTLVEWYLEIGAGALAAPAVVDVSFTFVRATAIGDFAIQSVNMAFLPATPPFGDGTL